MERGNPGQELRVNYANNERDPFNQNFRKFRSQNSMDRFGPTGKVSKKRVHLLRWTTFSGRTGWNFCWMDRAQQYTVTLFDCNHLTHVIVLWPMQKFVCYCTVFALFYFEFEGNFQVQALGSLYFEGLFNGGFFALQVWKGLYVEGLIFRILW